jgi:hypothetical protein
MDPAIEFQTGRPTLALFGPALSGLVASLCRAVSSRATVPEAAPKHGTHAFFRAVSALGTAAARLAGRAGRRASIVPGTMDFLIELQINSGRKQAQEQR